MYGVWRYTRKAGDRQGKVTNACFMGLFVGGGGIFAIMRLGPISKFKFCQCSCSIGGLLHVYHRMILRGGVST